MRSIVQMINEKAMKNMVISPATISRLRNLPGMDQSTVEWYRSEFPDDGAWEDIKDATFAEFLTALACHDVDRETMNMRGTKIPFEKFYGYDSIIRERLFRHLSDLTGVLYSCFYNKYFGK